MSNGILLRGVLVFSMAGAFFGATVSAQTARSQLGSSVQIQWGVVEDVSVGTVDPTAAAGQGAAIGGMLGLATGRSASRAAGGAAVGGLISNSIARHQKTNAPNAYTYRILLSDGSTTTVITETGDIRQGDCVSVEFGQTTNVRRVASEFCANPNDPVLKDPQVVADVQEEATECDAAKGLALNAANDQQMDLAMKKVRIFCES